MSDRRARDWEVLAQRDPYWAVVSLERFRCRNLSHEALQEFFQTGVEHVDLVFQAVRRRLDPEFAPRSALDFGCGVGRVLIPLAQRCEFVTGVDVSETMLREAEENCRRRGLSNVRLIRSDGSNASTLGNFDLLHSFIVFQHLRPDRGQAILRGLLPTLRPGGIGVLHFTYAAKHRHSVPRRLVGGVIRRLTGHSRAVMEMNPYDLNSLFRILQEHGVTRLHAEMTDHEFYGVILFFQNPAGGAGRQPGRA